MSEHKVTVEWQRETEGFSYESYSRDHTWTFEGGTQIQASAASAYRGNPCCIDPEEALVAALSSCHMLSFLAIAARKQFTVDKYVDKGVGFLEKNADGKLSITRVILRPRVTLSGKMVPSQQQIQQIHDRAHEECFIANSVKTDVKVEAEY